MQKKSDEEQFARDRKPIVFILLSFLEIMRSSIYLFIFKMIIPFWQNSFPETTAQDTASSWNPEMNFSLTLRLHM